MRAIRRVLAVAAFTGLLVVGWRFAARHPQPVRIDYLLGETGELALWVALLAAFAAGGVLIAILMGYQLVRLGMLARRYRKAAAKLDIEVHELRNLPLAPEAPPEDEPVPGAPLGPALERGS